MKSARGPGSPSSATAAVEDGVACTAAAAVVTADAAAAGASAAADEAIGVEAPLVLAPAFPDLDVPAATTDLRLPFPLPSPALPCKQRVGWCGVWKGAGSETATSCTILQQALHGLVHAHGMACTQPPQRTAVTGHRGTHRQSSQTGCQIEV